MRVVSYNMLNGGTGRVDPLTEVLLGCGADVVCLQEADLDAHVGYLARRLGLGHVAWGRCGLGRRHVAILSRGPFTWQQAITLSGGATALRVALAQPGFTLITCHLSPYALDSSERQRMLEWSRLASALAFVSGPLVLAGDFNAVAAADPVDLHRLRPRDQARLAAAGQQHIPRSVMSAVASAGLVDALQTCSAARATFPAVDPSLRIDHILTRGCTVRAAGVWHTRLARFASDHLPVFAEVDPAAASVPGAAGT